MSVSLNGNELSTLIRMMDQRIAKQARQDARRDPEKASQGPAPMQQSWQKLRDKLAQEQDRLEENHRRLEALKQISIQRGFMPTMGMAMWKCESEGNPVGLCVYDGRWDPAHDECIYCFEPEERK